MSEPLALAERMEDIIAAVQTHIHWLREVRARQALKGPGPASLRSVRLRNRFIDWRSDLEKAKEAFEAGE